MTTKRNVYTPDFKQSLVNLHNKDGQSFKSLSAEFGPHPDSIKKWVLDAQEITDGNGETTSVAEVRALKKELARVKEENEILKLAAVLLAKN